MEAEDSRLFFPENDEVHTPRNGLPAYTETASLHFVMVLDTFQLEVSVSDRVSRGWMPNH